MDYATTLTQNFEIIADIMLSIAVLMGVTLTLGGLFQLKKHGETRAMGAQSSGSGPVVMIVCGAIMLTLPSFLGTGLSAIFGQTSPLAYEGDTTGVNALIEPILILVRLVGVGAFMKGIMMASHIGGQHAQPGMLGKAVVHIISGILCVNVVQTLDLLKLVFNLD